MNIRWVLMACLVLVMAADEQPCNQLIRQLRSLTNESNPFDMITADNSKCVVRLAPHYFWAQNMTHLHVKFRFASSLDSPACSHLISFSKSVQHNGFSLQGLCISSATVFLYNLTVTTWKSLNTHYCTWKSEEMSNKILECLKSPFPFFWERLHSDAKYRSPNMHIWWEIYRKYREEIGDMIGHLGLEKEMEEEDSYYRVHKPRRNDRPISNHLSERNFYCYENSPYDAASWY